MPPKSEARPRRPRSCATGRRWSSRRTAETLRLRRQVTSEDAKRFFVERIVAQSSREGLSLSANERRMLDWSETEPGGISDPELVDALADEISDEDYEQKVCRLLDAAYEADVAADG